MKFLQINILVVVIIIIGVSAIDFKDPSFYNKTEDEYYPHNQPSNILSSFFFKQLQNDYFKDEEHGKNDNGIDKYLIDNSDPSDFNDSGVTDNGGNFEDGHDDMDKFFSSDDKDDNSVKVEENNKDVKDTVESLYNMETDKLISKSYHSFDGKSNLKSILKKWKTECSKKPENKKSGSSDKVLKNEIKNLPSHPTRKPLSDQNIVLPSSSDKLKPSKLFSQNYNRPVSNQFSRYRQINHRLNYRRPYYRPRPYRKLFNNDNRRQYNRPHHNLITTLEPLPNQHSQYPIQRSNQHAYSDRRARVKRGALISPYCQTNNPYTSIGVVCRVRGRICCECLAGECRLVNIWRKIYRCCSKKFGLKKD